MMYADFRPAWRSRTRAVVDTFAPGNVFYINMPIAITAQCDCWGMTTPALRAGHRHHGLDDIAH